MGSEAASSLSAAECRDLRRAAGLMIPADDTFRVPGADEGNIRIRPDRDHGRLTYEGKILYKGVEYEFEIDAATGEFTDWSEEH